MTELKRIYLVTERYIDDFAVVAAFQTEQAAHFAAGMHTARVPIDALPYYEYAVQSMLLLERMEP